MDGLHEIINVGYSKLIAGQTWQLLPLRVCDYAEAAEFLRSRKPRPRAVIAELGDALKSLPEALAIASLKHLLSLAYQDERDGDVLGLFDVERWFRTEEGHSFSLWCMLRQKHPTVTWDQTKELLQRNSALAMTAASEKDAAAISEAGKAPPDLNGLPRGNSSGPMESRAELDRAISPDAGLPGDNSLAS